MGLSVWCSDQAGPFQTVPQPGPSWCPEGQPLRQPHEYVRNGTAKALTLFHPADGHARVKGVTSCPNAVLHPWLKEDLTAIMASLLPPPAAVSMQGTWEHWRGDRSGPPSAEMPPLRMLLVLDNLAGHRTPGFVLWLFAHGIMLLDTPLGGSWLNMAESFQRILKRRALDGQEPAHFVVADDPAVRQLGPRAGQQLGGDLPAFLKDDLGGDRADLASLWVSGPILGQVKPAVERGVPLGRDVGQEDAELAVLDLAESSAPLAGDATTVVPFLERRRGPGR